MGYTLLVLAAGMGSRFGGLKQMEPVGPSGETLLDYGVFDACRAGFDRVVFVIRRDFEAAFRERVGARYAGKVAVDYVFQSLDALPPGFVPPAGREKPWGTGHAVWCAKEAVREPFAVINADDFYGADALRRLGEFLRGEAAVAARVPTYAMVGYRLASTLSEAGTVSRGLCDVGDDGRLRSITERTGIAASDVGPGGSLRGDELVSMNCWGFTPGLFPALDAAFHAFLRANAGELKAEFYLPTSVSGMIAAGEATVRLLPTSSEWFGVTHRADKPRVEAALRQLVARGEYPERLY